MNQQKFEESQIQSFVGLMLNARRAGLDPREVLENLNSDIRARVWQKFLEIRVDIRPATISNVASRSLCEHDSSQGPLWNQLRQFLLLSKERAAQEVDILDEASDQILSKIGDPRDETGKLPPVKGLVVGYVQSGKTANYTALTAKAFDAGYKIVIVLAGIHNSLRRQTQLRIEDELGLEESTAERPTAKMEMDEGPETITSVTNSDLRGGDFQNIAMSSNVLGNGRFLFVVKKNAGVLRNLLAWLPSSVSQSTLIIDDEADQATPNTRGNRIPDDVLENDNDAPADDDKSPTQINKQIRILLGRFRNRSYVGYTATPFANVFMDQNAVDREAGEDLFPEDFIVSLPKPDKYMGPEEFFGSNAEANSDEGPLSIRVIVDVTPAEVQSISRFEKMMDTFQFEADIAAALPKSLQNAVEDFVLATAIRRRKSKHMHPSSMLVHTTPSQEKQRVIRDAINQFWMLLRREYKYDNSQADSRWTTALHRYLERVHDPRSRFDLQELRDEMDVLLKGVDSVNILLLNHGSEDELNYEARPDLTAIVVGGNKLSRGLTLEGLIVSYFLRHSNQPKADTLTQMGRFFGFKGDYAELTRIYTTQDIVESFREVSEIEAALRRELEFYSSSGKTPREFAPRVLKRSILMPTAKNKMKAARLVGISYSGDLVQTTSFPPYLVKSDKDPDKSKIEQNALTITQIIKQLGKDNSTEIKNSLLWRDVDFGLAQKLLSEYEQSTKTSRLDTSLILKYIQDARSSGELSTWNLALISRRHDHALGSHKFSDDFEVSRIERALDKDSTSNIGALVNPLNLGTNSGDEIIDFTPEQLDKARDQSLSGKYENTVSAVRAQRDVSNGLLLVYPISPDSKGRTKGKNEEVTLAQGLGLDSGSAAGTIFGLSIVFPFSGIQDSKEYWQVAGKADRGAGI